MRPETIGLCQQIHAELLASPRLTIQDACLAHGVDIRTYRKWRKHAHSELPKHRVPPPPITHRAPQRIPKRQRPTSYTDVLAILNGGYTPAQLRRMLTDADSVVDEYLDNSL